MNAWSDLTTLHLGIVVVYLDKRLRLIERFEISFYGVLARLFDIRKLYTRSGIYHGLEQKFSSFPRQYFSMWSDCPATYAVIIASSAEGQNWHKIISDVNYLHISVYELTPLHIWSVKLKDFHYKVRPQRLHLSVTITARQSRPCGWPNSYTIISCTGIENLISPWFVKCEKGEYSVIQAQTSLLELISILLQYILIFLTVPCSIKSGVF